MADFPSALMELAARGQPAAMPETLPRTVPAMQVRIASAASMPPPGVVLAAMMRLRRSIAGVGVRVTRPGISSRKMTRLWVQGFQQPVSQRWILITALFAAIAYDFETDWAEILHPECIHRTWRKFDNAARRK